MKQLIFIIALLTLSIAAVVDCAAQDEDETAAPTGQNEREGLPALSHAGEHGVVLEEMIFDVENRLTRSCHAATLVT